MKKIVTILTLFTCMLGGAPVFASENTEVWAEYVHSVDDSTFYEATAEGIVVVDFYADWCGPCQKFAPIYKQVAEEMEGTITFIKVRVEDAPKALRDFNVTSIPTIVVLKDGEEIKRHGSFPNAESFRTFLLEETLRAAIPTNLFHITDTNFDTVIAKGDVIVDFYADWCGPCQRFGPIFEETAKNCPGPYIFAKANADKCRDAMSKYDVTGIPTVIAFHEGEEVKRKVGGSPNAEAFEQWVLSAYSS